MDGVRAVFERKAQVVARCYGEAVEEGVLPRGAKGYTTLLTTIETDGKARGTKIGETDLKAAPFHRCVIERVEGFNFPRPPKLYRTSHTYRFQEL